RRSPKARYLPCCSRVNREPAKTSWPKQFIMAQSELNDHLWPLIVPPFPRRSSSRNCLVTKKAHSPTRKRGKKGCSNRPKAEHSYSMKSASSSCRCKQNFCACWKKELSAGSAV